MKSVLLTVTTICLVCSAAAFALVLPAIVDKTTDFGLTSFYGQTTWPTGHRDSRNSGFVPLVTPTILSPTPKWTALQGASVLAAITIGPEGSIYATTGQAASANIHAFDKNGTLLWASNLPDSGAVGSSAVVDVDGDLYLSDSDQLWAFHPDGSVKWVTPINSALITAVVTNQGFVGGVAINGSVYLFNRVDGVLVSNVFSLPLGTPLPPSTPPPGVWQNMMDPARIPHVFAALVGTGSQIVNTPAVDPVNNRMFITAAGPIVGGAPTGRLYGIDISETGQLSLAFTGVMGPGSGTSPVISADGSTVYAADAIGNMFAFDALTSAPTAAPLWIVNIGSSLGAPSIGPDGTLYTVGGDKVTAIAPNGVKLWERSFDAQAQALPLINETAAPRRASANSVISVSAKHVYVTANLGYRLTLSGGTIFILPAKSALFALDRQTGAIVATPVFLPDVSEGFVTLASDGSMYITHGATYTSIALNYVIPSLSAGALKTALSALALRPVGGISTFSPQSFLNLGKAGVQWVQELNTIALESLSGAALDDAYTAIRRATVQLDATVNTLRDAERAGEIDSPSARTAKQALALAKTLLSDAKRLVVNARIASNHGLITAASKLIQNAQSAIDKAVSVLG